MLSAGIVLRAVRSKTGLDCNDDAVLHANIDRGIIKPSARKFGVSNNEIQCH